MPPRSKSSQQKSTMEDEPPKQQTPEKRGSRTRVSAACEACKKRKTKCSGEPPPCQMCQTMGTECVIDLSLDMRRRAAMQQTLFDSKSYQESLNGLIDCVRYGNPEVIQSLREVFRRDDTTKDEALAAIHQWAQLTRERMPHPQQDDRLIVGTDKASTVDLRHQASPSLKSEEHAQRTPSDTSTRVRPQEDKESDPAAYLRAVLRRLRECSDLEGEHILGTMLRASSISDVQKTVLVDDASVQDGRRIERNNPQMVDGVSVEQSRMFWHPALQPGAGSFMSEFPAEEVHSFHGGAHGDRRHYDAQILADHASLVAPETRTLAGCLMGDITDGIQKEQILQDGVHTEALTASVVAPKPPVADLLVIKEGSNAPVMVPIHLVQPLLILDDSSLSRIYTDYLYGAREMVANKAPISEILGSAEDVVVDLFFRERQHQDQWDCSSWASETCRGFTEFEVYVRLAAVLMMTRLMQWMIVPTAESYANLPNLMKPTPTQRMMPHIGAIDLIPIPCIRDAVIEKPRDWLTALAQARFTVNWPYFQDDAVEYDPISRSRRLTRRFIDHVSNYDNWSVGSQFLNSFPDVAGRIRIHS